MLLEKVTLELPVELMRSARLVAEKSGSPIEQVLQSSLAQMLPPLDDLPFDEAAAFASMILLSDAKLWEIAREQMDGEIQEEFARLLDGQSAGELTAQEQARLENLQEQYGAALVRTSHAYLLLARRGYRVPMQEDL